MELRRVDVNAHGAGLDEGSELAIVSFTAFYQSEFAGQVRRAAILTGSGETAHDVVHDAMLEVYRRWDSLDSPGAYLNRAVLNGCYQSGRHASAQNRLMSRLVNRHPQTDVAEVLDDVLADLPFKHRAAVVLRYYAGLSTDEIATVLNCAPGSVGPWVDRALKKMRKALQ